MKKISKEKTGTKRQQDNDQEEYERGFELGTLVFCRSACYANTTSSTSDELMTWTGRGIREWICRWLIRVAVFMA